MSSAFAGRRGLDMAFLRELNPVPGADAATDDDTLNPDGDLAIFTNTIFHDFDSGQNTDYQAAPIKADADASAPSSNEDLLGELGNLDFMPPADFDFPDLSSTYPTPTLSAFPEGMQNLQHLPPNAANVYSSATAVPHQAVSYLQRPAGLPEKRKPEVSRPTLSKEEAARMAAEEDKRRRNTAASARFRVKKKQRELALEKSAKEMTEKVTALETKIQQLETENKWLKNLIMEKNDGKDDVGAALRELNSRTKATSGKSLGIDERSRASDSTVESPE